MFGRSEQSAYICSMNKEIREVYYSKVYEDYYGKLSDSVKEKYDYVEYIIKTIRVVNKKFVKHLEDTDLYEARMLVGNNEYRTILFAIDRESFVEASRILFLNSFLKKSTKDYKKEIKTAYKILENYRRKQS